MKRHIVVALIALNIVACFGAPQNNAAVSVAETSEVEVVAERAKGDLSVLDGMQNDQMVRTCANYECRVVSVADTKAMDAAQIQSVFALKAGDQQLTKALSSPAETAMESLKGLDAQRAMIENLQREMAAFTNTFDKGIQVADNAKAQFSSMMSKAATPPAQPLSKGTYAAALPPSKGGNAAANSMALEAAMCPMTMYELGKCQKLGGEMRAQLTNANSLNAMLMGQKSRCESELQATKVAKMAAEQQAAFNAKYAAEQKQKADMLALALAQANSEKAALQEQKAQLESVLADTQTALAEEKETTAALTSALSSCNEDKAQLQEEKAQLISELQDTQEVLRQTQRALQREQDDHARTQRQLRATQQELEATEEARKQLEEAKEQLEDELAETKNQLDSMTAERDQLQVTLDATSALLASCTEDKLQCQADLANEKALSEQLTNQLSDALAMLAAEKKAREELTATIMAVKAASEKVQEEVRKLQLENVQLQQQVMKLKAEQEAALSMAAGCPPTYEKFGISCYKYVREKTQWKMAQEQCMKDGGNLVSVESRQEQAFLVDYLKRHGASQTDAYSMTSGNKQMNHWKWLGSYERHIGATGPQYWYNQITQMKPGYDCQAMYLSDQTQYGKWVGLPCYSAAPYTCEYLIAPHGSPVPASAAETVAMAEMYAEAPQYLQPASGYSKGSYAYAPPSKGGLSFASKGYSRS